MKNKLIIVISILAIIGFCIGWYQVVEYRENCISTPNEYFINGYGDKIYIYKDYCSNPLPNGTPMEILRQ